MNDLDRLDCPPEATLRLWLEDELSEDEGSRVEAHLDGCEPCTETILSWTTDEADDQILADLSESSWSGQVPAWVSSKEVVFSPGGEPGGLGLYRQFDVRRRIDSGSMGIVFEAWDTRLKRRVAIKIPHPELAAIADFRALFEREAINAAQVTSAHTLQIYEVHPAHSSFFYPVLVMEYAAGGSLKTVLHRDRPMDPRRAAEIALQVAEGLASIHRMDIVHRDVKPSNIMLDSEGVAKVADFGLAFGSLLSIMSGDESDVGGGTVAYLAPERLDLPARAEAKSDLFSFGVLFYEMLTGRRPFEGATADEVREQIRNSFPVRPSKIAPRIPRTLDQLVLRCLQKRPEDRIVSAEDVARTLHRFLRGRKRVVALLASTLPLSLITLTLGWQLRQNSRINELVEQQALAISQVDDDLSLASLERMRSRLERLRMIAPDLAGEEAKKMIQARFIAIKRRIQTSERIDEKARQDLASLIEVQATIDETGAGLLREHLKRRRPDWQILADLHGPSWGDFQTVFEPMAVKLVDQTLGLRNNAKPPASTPTVVRFQTDCDAKMVVTFRGGTWSAGSRAGVAMFDNQWHSEPIWELAFTPDGKSLAASGRDGGVQFWGLAERRPIGWIREDGKPTNRFAFIDARKMVLAGSTGIRRRDLDLNSSFDVGMEIGKGLGVAKVVASPNGTIAVSSYDGKIRLNGHWGNRTLVSDGQALALAISRDGKILASGGHSGTIQLWEAETGSKLRSLAGHAGPVNALVFSPGRGLLCSGGNDATVRTWDVDSGRLRATRSHQANVRCLAVAPDDSTLASAGDDGLTRLWDLDTDRPKGLPMAGHSSPILAAAFSADSRSLATGGSDATIRLWEVESGRTTELIRQRSYELIVQAPSSTAIPSPPTSLADAIRDQIPLSLRIVRDGLVLRERPILLSEGDLTIRASVVGDEVSVQVGEAPPLILREIIPLSLSGEGRFGLIWPSGGRITELRLERRSQAVEPDRIEVADRDFARRRFAQARDRYRELATKSDTPVSAIQEAQFKAALCNLALSDDKSAREGFQAVAAQLTSAAERWPLVAACQLWLFQLRHNEKDEAEKTFTNLSARFQFEQLAEYIPIEIPSQICRQYSWPSMYFYFRGRSPPGR